MSDIQPAAKLVHLLVAVSPDDETSMSSLETLLKATIKRDFSAQVTVVGAEYLFGGKVYRRPDWEAWDGTGEPPQALYQPDTPTWMYQKDAEVPDEPVEAPEPVVEKSPAEALAGVTRRRGRQPKAVVPPQVKEGADELDPVVEAPPGGSSEVVAVQPLEVLAPKLFGGQVVKEKSPDGINTDTVDTETGERSRTLLAPGPRRPRQQTSPRKPVVKKAKKDDWGANDW